MQTVIIAISLIWLMTCNYYDKKLGFKSRKYQPIIIGTMPYAFLPMMIYGGVSLNDNHLLMISLLGFAVVISATVYSIQKIKKFYYPINGSLKAGNWIIFPGIVFFCLFGINLIDVFVFLRVENFSTFCLQIQFSLI